MERAAPLRDLHVDALPTEYVLGLGWDGASNRYHLRVKPMHQVNTKAITRSFDPSVFVCR